MTGKEGVTFIMPAYNVENYISQAVESVKSQTIGDWHLLIIDDGSTDKTPDIAKELASTDERIRYHRMEHASGSAYQPRKFGILKSETEWVFPLDADDWLSPTCLEELILKQKSTDADIVYPSMYLPESSTALTPQDPDILQGVREGKECVKLTLDGWRINCNGGIIRKSLYEKAFREFDSSVSYSCADEMLTRQLLSITPKVSFSSAKYFYRDNEESITRKKSIKLFDILINNEKLLTFTEENFGKDSEEHLLAHRQNFHGYFDSLRLLNSHDFTPEEKEIAEERILNAARIADLELLKGKASSRYIMLMKIGLPRGRKLLKIIDKVWHPAK